MLPGALLPFPPPQSGQPSERMGANRINQAATICLDFVKIMYFSIDCLQAALQRSHGIEGSSPRAIPAQSK
jgi:hypothetical protein